MEASTKGEQMHDRRDVAEQAWFGFVTILPERCRGRRIRVLRLPIFSQPGEDDESRGCLRASALFHLPEDNKPGIRSSDPARCFYRACVLLVFVHGRHFDGQVRLRGDQHESIGL
jgi:hypothetical protein